MLIALTRTYLDLNLTGILAVWGMQVNTQDWPWGSKPAKVVTQKRSFSVIRWRVTKSLPEGGAKQHSMHSQIQIEVPLTLSFICPEGGLEHLVEILAR